MLSNIEVRDAALAEVKLHKIEAASKACAAKDPNLVIVEDDERVVWAHYKEGTRKFHNEIPWDYLDGLHDYCWCGRRLGEDDTMVLMNKYVEADGEFVLYEITI